MKEALQQMQNKEESPVYYEQKMKPDSLVINANSSIKQSEVIIAFYLMGIKPPWMMRMVYGD